MVMLRNESGRYYYSGDGEIYHNGLTEIIPCMEKRKWAYEFKTLEDAMAIVKKFPDYEFVIEENAVPGSSR